MGRMSTLEENGFKKGTKEYEYWEDNFLKLDKLLFEIIYNSVTLNRIQKIYDLLKEAENNNLEFTVGDIYYKDLKDFLYYGRSILKNDFIKRLLDKYCWTREINPISYGYDSKEFKNITKNIINANELFIKGIK